MNQIDAEIIRVRQDRDAQFAHNSRLLERIKELEEDNEMYGKVLGTLQGILDKTGSTGHIYWNITDRVKALVAEIDEAWFMIEHGWDIEDRAWFERESKTNGFKYALAQAVHHMWKRRVQETQALFAHGLAATAKVVCNPAESIYCNRVECPTCRGTVGK